MAMKKKDARLGATVYHSIFTTWGKGVIRGIHESIFDAKIKFYIIDFEFRDEPVRLEGLSGLRKTPNRTKIKAMVEMYRSRGTEAIDGGDRLILPDQKNETR